MDQANPFADLGRPAETQQVQRNGPSEETNPFVDLAKPLVGQTQGGTVPVAQPSSTSPYEEKYSQEPPEVNPFADMNEDANPFKSLAKQQQIQKDSSTPGYMDQSWYQASWDWLNKPLIDIRQLDQSATGFRAGFEDVISSFSSPLSIALAATTAGSGALLEALGTTAVKMMPALKTLRAVITLGFGAQQATSLVQTSGRFFEAIQAGDYDTAKELSVQAAAGLASVVMTAHAIHQNSILPEGLGKVIASEDRTSKTQLTTNTYRADNQRSFEFAQRTMEDLNTKIKDLPEASRAAILLRSEYPEQAQIEKVRDVVKASVKALPKYKDLYDQAVDLKPEHVDFINNELNPVSDRIYSEAEKGDIGAYYLQKHIFHIWKDTAKDPDHFADFKENARTGKIDDKLGWARSHVYNKFAQSIMMGKELEVEDPIAIAGWQQHTVGQELAMRRAIDVLRNVEMVDQDGRPITMLSGIGRTVSDEKRGTAILIDQNAMKDRSIPDNYIKNVLGGVQSQKFKQMLDNNVIEKTQTGYVWRHTGYKVVPHHAFKDWSYGGKAEDGTTTWMKSDIRVHPNHYDAVINGLGIDESLIRNNEIGKLALDISSVGKSAVFFSNFGHFVQAAGRSIFSGKAPFEKDGFGIENPVIYKLIQHGLGFMSHDESVEAFAGQEAPNGGLKGINKIPIAGDVNQWIHEKLWNYVNNIKAQASVDLVNRYKQAYPDWDDNQTYTKAALDANNRFGIQNMSQLGLNKTWKDAMQIAFLAPDWFLSEIRSMASLFQPGNKVIASDMVKNTALMITMAQVANLAISGKARWDHPFSLVVPGDGKKPDQLYSFRSLPGDMAHFAGDFSGAFSNRLSPSTVNILLRAFTGRDKFGKPLNTEEQIHAAITGVAPMWLQPALGSPNTTDDWKAMLLKGVMAQGGMQEYVGRTTAEKAAMQMSYANTGSSDPDEIHKHVIRMRILDGLKAGTVTVQQAVQSIGLKDTKTLLKETRQTPLQAHFAHLPVKQSIEVWDFANSQEKSSLKNQMMLKRARWFMENKGIPHGELAKTKEFQGLSRIFPELLTK